MTLSFSLAYAKTGYEDIDKTISALVRNVTGVRKIQHVQLIGTSEEALYLGELASLGFCFMRNRDDTNAIKILTATSGTAFVRLIAGDFAFFRFGDGVTAPYALATVGACYLEYSIWET